MSQTITYRTTCDVCMQPFSRDEVCPLTFGAPMPHSTVRPLYGMHVCINCEGKVCSAMQDAVHKIRVAQV